MSTPVTFGFKSPVQTHSARQKTLNAPKAQVQFAGGGKNNANSEEIEVIPEKAFKHLTAQRARDLKQSRKTGKSLVEAFLGKSSGNRRDWQVEEEPWSLVTGLLVIGGMTTSAVAPFLALPFMVAILPTAVKSYLEASLAKSLNKKLD